MPSDSYKPGQKIRVRHTDATNKSTVYDGEIIEHIHEDVWRVTFGGFGLTFLMTEKDIQNAENEA